MNNRYDQWLVTNYARMTSSPLGPNIIIIKNTNSCASCVREEQFYSYRISVFHRRRWTWWEEEKRLWAVHAHHRVFPCQTHPWPNNCANPRYAKETIDNESPNDIEMCWKTDAVLFFILLLSFWVLFTMQISFYTGESIAKTWRKSNVLSAVEFAFV